MLVHVHGAKCIGIDALRVTVEVDIHFGIGIHLVGMADISVKESLLRTTTALDSAGFKIPGRKIVINLAPADLRKNGGGYDLPIAVGIIAASEQMSLPDIGKYIIMGELGLAGEVRPVPGALPFAELARAEGFDGCILPAESALEALEFCRTKVYAVQTLQDVVRILAGQEDCSDLLVESYRKRYSASDGTFCTASGAGPRKDGILIDFADIIGQESAKRGVEIAAAGGHNLLLLGAPGSGKSSLAKAMAGILPPMTLEESLVTSKIYSISGKGDLRRGLIRQRPFRSPHCSASVAAIIGGGGGDSILPGEVSLAQNGVLFLDEFGQMPRSVVEALRAPIEDRRVTISRLRSKVEYPASFMMVAASNPCPCGWWGEGDRCTCTPSQRQNYLSKLSGPILDRLDLHIIMHPVDSSRILGSRKAESSAEVAARVLAARNIQENRFAAINAGRSEKEKVFTNAEMSNKLIEMFCPLSGDCQATMERLMAGMGLSMRAYFRIIKVARTIADLEGSPDITVAHLTEAAGYRFLDRQNLPK